LYDHARAMIDPLKWKYEAQAGLLVSAIAGTGFGTVIAYQSGNGWLGTFIWAPSALLLSAGRFILIGSFVCAHDLLSTLPTAMVHQRI
jgi:hypothetical protein